MRAEVQELRARYAASIPAVRRLIENEVGRRVLQHVPADPSERDAARARVLLEVLRHYARVRILRARPTNNPPYPATRDD